jgi:hypothetical protein
MIFESILGYEVGIEVHQHLLVTTATHRDVMRQDIAVLVENRHHPDGCLHVPTIVDTSVSHCLLWHRANDYEVVTSLFD